MGLVSTGDVGRDARDYLEAVNSRELSAALQVLISDAQFQRAPSQDHQLLGKAAKDFSLSDSGDREVSLTALNRQGPVVLVFYYGYSCAHCVAQLIALERDLAYFRELGAEVVAVSADPTEETRARFAEFGGFSFPLLSDPDYKVSADWGVYFPATADRHEDLLHGTFLIDPAGSIRFANCGYQPFLDNRSLLCWLAEMQSDGVSASRAAPASTSPTRDGRSTE